jgi:hypothetical protein
MGIKGNRGLDVVGPGGFLLDFLIVDWNMFYFCWILVILEAELEHQ